MLLALVASITASAGAIGDDYSIGGFGAGWVLVGIAIIGFVLIYFKVFKKELGRKILAPFVAILLIGLALQFVTIEEPATAEIAPSDCPEFDISGNAIISGTYYITTAVFDNDTMTLTVPLTVQDSSDGNLTDHKTGVNLTVDPIAIAGGASDISAVIHFDSDYLMKYGGEYVLDESGDEYEAVWTKPGMTTKRYAGTYDLTVAEEGWLQIDYTMNNATAGNWVSELSQIGDTVTWYITLSTTCGWRETITVNGIVISYTA